MREPAQRRSRSVRVAALVGLVTIASAAANPARAQQTAGSQQSFAASPPTKLSLPFTKTTLDNGLVVILHEDHALPMIAVNIMYKVGSRFEVMHRTGFAHLFEHLMFMGTTRVPTKMFDAWMEAEGGWNNAWTSEDRTDYYDIGPSNTLPLLLWLEADRLSSLGHDMTQEKLDAQREVVRNERRQTSENTPYGKVELVLPELLWPEGHPYHHPVIGSHEDLQAATVDDVKSFFDHFYLPNNASLVIAGDVDPQEAMELVKKDFGFLKPGTVEPAPAAPKTKLDKVVRKTIEDEVNLPKIILAWTSPPRFAKGDAELDIAAEILSKGKSSRLYKSLVYDKPLAQEIDANQQSQDLGSVFTVEAIARPGVDLDKLEAAMELEVQKLVDAPVTSDELVRAQNGYETAFVSRLQGVEARAALLNQYQMALGDPGFVEKDLDRYRAVTAADLQAQAKSTFDMNARVVLRVVPRPKERPPTPPPSKEGKTKKSTKKGAKK